MTERARVRMRRIGMKRSLLPLVLLAAVLVGCGDDRDKDTTAAPADGETAIEMCEVGPPSGPDRELGAVDVDGDGKDDPLHLEQGTSPGATCPSGPMVIVAVGEGMATAPAPVPFDDSLPIAPKDIRGVTVPGHKGDLVLVVQNHPRGGFSAHLSAFEGGRMRGVGSADGALAPFVATDAPTAYLSARCTSTGIEITKAVAHQPVGVVAAWDVERTTIPGADLTDGVTEKVADNLRQGQFEDRFPELVRNSLFENC
jgi:hypothetical protein